MVPETPRSRPSSSSSGSARKCPRRDCHRCRPPRSSVRRNFGQWSGGLAGLSAPRPGCSVGEIAAATASPVRSADLAARSGRPCSAVAFLAIDLAPADAGLRITRGAVHVLAIGGYDRATAALPCRIGRPILRAPARARRRCRCSTRLSPGPTIEQRAARPRRIDDGRQRSARHERPAGPCVEVERQPVAACGGRHQDRADQQMSHGRTEGTGCMPSAHWISSPTRGIGQAAPAKHIVPGKVSHGQSREPAGLQRPPGAMHAKSDGQQVPRSEHCVPASQHAPWPAHISSDAQQFAGVESSPGAPGHGPPGDPCVPLQHGPFSRSEHMSGEAQHVEPHCCCAGQQTVALAHNRSPARTGADAHAFPVGQHMPPHETSQQSPWSWSAHVAP